MPGAAVVTLVAVMVPPPASSNAVCLFGTIQQLAAHISAPPHGSGVQVDCKNACDKAWTVLLDLGTSAVQGEHDVTDEHGHIELALAKVCSELAQQHRTTDAAELQQLVQDWLSSTQYMARCPGQLEAACSSSTTTRYAAMPLSEQRAMLSLLLALQDSCPAATPVLTTLPALGSNLLKGLQQEAQAAAATAASSNGSSWIPMTPQLEALLAEQASGGQGSTTGRAAAFADGVQAATAQQQQQPQQKGAAGAASGAGACSSWISPAAAAMQVLQQIPLDAAAVSSIAGSSQWLQQQQGDAAADAVLLADACDAGASSAAVVDTFTLQQLGAAGPPPLLQCVTQQMQLASLQPSISRPLGMSSSGSSGRPPGGSSHGKSNPPRAHSSGKPTPELQPTVSAPAADAAAAVRAAADVKPCIGSLMQSSSCQPGSRSSALLGKKPDTSSSSSSSSKAGGCLAGSAADTAVRADTAPDRDVLGRCKLPLLQRGQQLQPQGSDRWHPTAHPAAHGSSGSGSSAREEEGVLLSTACLALQGVWCAVQQLWDLVLQEPVSAGGPAGASRTLGLCGTAVQQRLLVQVLHSAELRLRIKAFMQHFQHASFGSSSSSSSSGDASGSKQPGPCSLQGGCGADGSRSSKGTQDHGSPATAVSVQRAFLDAVAQVLSEHDASLATGQVQKLLQQQRRRGGGTASLLQLLTTQRGMARQLQQLAEVCCCTVQVFMEERPFLKDSIITAEGVCRLGRWQDVAADSASSSTSTSSTINFHVLQAVRGGQQSRLAAAAGFVSAAADAYKQSALPWPGHAEMAAALQLGWAPSSWQMCRGFEGGNVLLERLYAGVLQASPEAAPLLQHLLAATMQPVQQSLRSWALLPDTSAAEAAAEVTAMASFTAGVSSTHSGSSTARQAAGDHWGCAGGAAAEAAMGGAAGGSLSAAGSSVRDHTAVKQWAGSRAAEGAIKQCLQQAWEGICQASPGCPAFLAFLQQPAAVAGSQLQLLQLLGGHGRALAERLGWLAALEQQELLEATTPPPSPAAVSTGTAAQAEAVAWGPVPVGQSPAFQSALHTHIGPSGQDGFMGLLGSSSILLEGPAGQGAWGVSNLTTQQLAQCAAIIADYEAARQAEVQQLLQSLAQQRAASLAAHELWLFDRQLERQRAEETRKRLQEEAAARRRLRQRLLLAQQQEEVTAAQARRAGARLEELAYERALLQQAALQEHQEALQQLQGELALLSADTALTVAAAAGPTAAPGAASTFAAASSAADTAVSCKVPAAAACETLDVDSITLQIPEPEAAAPAAAAPAAAPTAAAGCIPRLNLLAVSEHLEGPGADVETGCAANSNLPQQQQQQQQGRRERGRWRQPVPYYIPPAAGAPSSKEPSEPLAVVGSAAAAAGAAAGPATQQAAGRRSNSQPKLLAGMGRPVSLSRRNSSSDGGRGSSGGGSGGATDGASAAAVGDSSSASLSNIGGVGAAATAGLGPGRAGRSSAVSGAGSILGGMGVSAVQGTAAGSWGQQQAAHGLQRSASTGNVLEHHMDAHLQQQQQQQGASQAPHPHQQLQRRPSGGLGPSSSSSSRPSTPRGRRFSEHAGWEAAAGYQLPQPHQHLSLQQSWHRMHQQRLLEPSVAPAAATAAAGGGGGGADGSVGSGTAAAAGGPVAAAGGAGGVASSSTGYLMSRHQQQQSENKGNSMILSWVLQQNGLGSNACSQHSTAAHATHAAAAEDAEQHAHPQEPSAGAEAAAPVAVKPRASHTATAPAAAGAAAAGAGPMVAALEVLLVQPIMTHQRLTTHACWSLLLQEHRLLQRLGAVQGLFFQQQGDWVMLLCESLEPLLQRQQQQQQQQRQSVPGTGGAAVGAAGAAGVSVGAGQAAQLSPVVLQLLLESAVQQSCLAGAADAERVSLQAVPGRTLAGWSLTHNSSSSSSTSTSAAAAHAAAAAGDCLQLRYEAPWPLSLLLGHGQLTQYAEVFNVLLRLRRLQQQLVKQWRHLNHRASSSSSSSSTGGVRRPQQQQASQRGTGYHRSSSGSNCGARKHGTWALEGAMAAVPAAAAVVDGGEGAAGASGAASEGLRRLQVLRRWHVLALHCVDSLLGFMLGELSGQLQAEFEAAVGSRPVSLPVMLEAHAQLLAAARQVCLLPREQLPQGAAEGGGIAAVVYAIVEAAWQLQQQVAQLLGVHAGAAVGAGSSGVAAAARCPAGCFREGSECTSLAVALATEAGALWESALEPAGLQLEHLVEVLKRRLRSSSVSAASVGHHLAARLGA